MWQRTRKVSGWISLALLMLLPMLVPIVWPLLTHPFGVPPATFVDHLPAQREIPGDCTVCIVPVGDVSPAALRTIAGELRGELGESVAVLDPIPLTRNTRSRHTLGVNPLQIGRNSQAIYPIESSFIGSRYVISVTNQDIQETLVDQGALKHTRVRFRTLFAVNAYPSMPLVAAYPVISTARLSSPSTPHGAAQLRKLILHLVGRRFLHMSPAAYQSTLLGLGGASVADLDRADEGVADQIAARMHRSMSVADHLARAKQMQDQTRSDALDHAQSTVDDHAQAVRSPTL